MQLDGQWRLPNWANLSPFLRLAWMHDFSPTRGVPRSFAELPEFSFNSSAIPVVTDAADIHAGIQFQLGSNVSFDTKVDAQLASSYSTIGASGTFQISW